MDKCMKWSFRSKLAGVIGLAFLASFVVDGGEALNDLWPAFAFAFWLLWFGEIFIPEHLHRRAHKMIDPILQKGIDERDENIFIAKGLEKLPKELRRQMLDDLLKADIKDTKRDITNLKKRLARNETETKKTVKKRGRTVRKSTGKTATRSKKANKKV